MSSRASIKANFQTGDIPTQTQFEDLIDSLAHASEDGLATSSSVTSAISTAVSGKQATLISGTNIKTINGGSVLGSGDLVVTGDGIGVGFDDLLQTKNDNTQVFPDPFFTDTTLSTNYIDGLSPFVLSGGWTSLSHLSGRKYPIGKVLLRPVGNVSLPRILLSLDKLGLVSGDVIQIVVEAKYMATATTTTGSFMYGEFIARNGVPVGSAPDIIVASSGTPMTTTLHTFTSGNITIPSGVGGFRLSAGSYGVATQDWAIESFRVIKGDSAAPSRPVQDFVPANIAKRLAYVEEANMQSLKNNLLLRRTTYSSLSVARSLGGGSVQAAFSGYGQSYLASVCPSGGFNAIRQLWKWVVGDNSPSRIYVGVTTSATGVNPLNAGKFLASGYIDVDPDSGSAGNECIQLFGPDGQPRTIVPADLLDLVGIYFSSVKSDGTSSSTLYVDRAENGYTDPALPVYQIPSGTIGYGFGDGFTANIGAAAWSPDLVLLTDPVTSADVASAKLANSIASKVAEQPDLIALPQKMWCLVGRPCWVHYATIQTRDHRTNAFNSSSTSSVSRNQVDGFVHTASSAGNVTVSITGEANGIETAPKSVVFSSVATSTGAGTARFLMLGDSMTANGSMQSRLNALAVGDVTSVVNMGTVGSDPVKNEGYSGQPNGIFFSSGNPFYNPGTQDFDFSYYMTNLGVSNPTHVLLASGFWHVASATSDAEALANIASLVAQFERMITSIHARSSTIKIGIWTNPIQPYAGQNGESQQVTSISSARRRRNAILLGSKMIEAFSGREADKVYSVCTGQTMNPQTGYPMSELVPMDASVSARISSTTYANYAALTADLTPAAGTISLVASSIYYIKVWGTGTGHWRQVTESDGFERRVTDSIHPSAGYNAMGDLVWAWIKATI